MKIRTFADGQAHAAFARPHAASAQAHAGSARQHVSLLAAVLSVCLSTVPISGVAQTGAATSPANLEAISRVQIRTYEMQEAGGERVEYGLFVPTNYQPTV